jgi:hypothetical protein
MRRTLAAPMKPGLTPFLTAVGGAIALAVWERAGDPPVALAAGVLGAIMLLMLVAERRHR